MNPFIAVFGPAGNLLMVWENDGASAMSASRQQVAAAAAAAASAAVWWYGRVHVR